MSDLIHINADRKADFSMTYDFPLKVYETSLLQKPHLTNPWHWHDELQFCIILEGVLEITVLDKTFILNTGEGIFVNSGILHTSHSCPETPAKYLCLNIHPSFFTFFKGNTLEAKYVLPYLENENLSLLILKPEETWQKNILASIQQVSYLTTKKNYGYELEVYAEMMQIWKTLVLNVSFVKPNVSTLFHQKEIKTILSYLETHFSESITLNDLSDAVHTSKSWCCRIFKQALGCTINEYLTDLRIRASMNLLRTTDLSITEIAYRTGFSDSSYYIKKFNESVHVTPRVYRNERNSL